MDIEQAIAEAAVTKKLFLDNERLEEIPAQIFDLTDLEELRLIACGIRELPAAMARLQKLKILDLALNLLERFPSVIPQLTNLRQLGLAATGVQSLPAALIDLDKLSALVLSGNQIAHFPETLRRLPSLEHLDLGANLLESLPTDLTGLKSLNAMILRSNSFDAFPPSLLALPGLQVIDLSHGGPELDLGQRMAERLGVYLATFSGGAVMPDRATLESLPRSIGALISLEWLLLDDNDIEHLPPSIERLFRLRGLSLRGNRLGAVPDQLPPSLEFLDLAENPVRALPRSLGRLARLEHLDLRDTELPVPPEILSSLNPRSIADYIARLEATETRPLNEAKLLIVGEATVGKTSLVKRLVHNEFDPHESKTDGIRTTPWPVAGITLNMWDFGGQEIMHATHQFFLTRRSVYLLVINARQDEDQNRLEYWLKMIQSFSGGSKVILVGNKTDDGPLDVDQRGLRAKYSDICDIIAVSCLTGDGIEDLKASIARVVDGMSHVRDLLPGGFFAVKQHLERMDRNYISFEEYHKLCRENGILPAASQELLIGFLHDLGTVLCFRDDPRLADTNILNPAWVTGGVYKILNSHLAAQRKGLLTVADVHEILESIEYPSERRLFIIDMMKRFELCFESEGTFLVPDLLTKEEPDTGLWDDTLEFVIKYDVLPPSVMSRLIVRMHQAISKRTVWRTGMVLAAEKNRALVKADREDATLTIQVSGPRNGRRGLLTAIRLEARSIAQTIPGLAYQELIPVPGNPSVKVPYSHLLDLEAAGRTTVVPQGMVTDVSIREMLDGVETPTERSVVARRVDEVPPQGDEPSTAWSPRSAFVFAGLLLASVLVVFAAAALGGRYLGDSPLPALGAAVAVVGIIGVFVLRASGRLSEQGFLETLKELLSKKQG